MICWVASLAAPARNPTRSTRAARLAAALVSRSAWSQPASTAGTVSASAWPAGGEGHPGPGPGEQPHSQLALQLLDLLGQRRLGHEQPFRRAGQVPFLGDGGEVAQQPRVDIHAIRLWIACIGRPPGYPVRLDCVFTAYVVIAIVTIAANVWAAAVDLAPARFVLGNMAEVGVPRSWLLPLGVLKGAGAAGLVIGLLGVRPLGIAAAIGLVLFFTGALAAHVRTRVFHNIAVPGTYFALAVAAAALAIAH